MSAAHLSSLRLETPIRLGNYTVDVVAVASEITAENQVCVLSASSTVATLSFTVDNIDDPVGG